LPPCRRGRRRLHPTPCQAAGATHLRWRPGPGTYQVRITRHPRPSAGDPGRSHTITEAETVIQHRQGEWNVDLQVTEFLPLGEKWAELRTWTLGPGATVSITDRDGEPVPGIPSPVASGPATVRLAVQNPDVGDVVDAGEGEQYVLPHEDGYWLEVLPTA